MANHPNSTGLDARLLHELHAYAVSRLTAGDGIAACEALGLAHPDVLAAYEVGCLPESVLDVLSSDDAQSVASIIKPGWIVIPLYDPNGHIVDLVQVDPAGEAEDQRLTSVPGVPARPMLTTLAGHRVTVVRSLSQVADAIAGGQPHTLWLPACVDFQLLEALDIEPVLAGGDTAVRFDQASDERPTHLIDVGPIRLAIDRGSVGASKRRVVARQAGRSQGDRFDLNEPKQCERFARVAAQRIGQEPATVLAAIQSAWPEVVSHEQAEAAGPAFDLDPADEALAMGLLTAPDLLAHVEADLTALGWIGEPESKRLLYLSAVSRFLDQPVWSVYQAVAGGAPWHHLSAVAALMPPEQTVVFHRLTESALRQAGTQGLRHRLLLVDRAETLRPEGALALRVLSERGGVALATAQAAMASAQEHGSNAAIGEVRGPVAVLAAAAGPIDPRCRDCFFTVPVDERPEHTKAMIAGQALLAAAGPSSPRLHESIIVRHHALQRCLQPRPVVIPFARRISFPMGSVRHRAEHRLFLGLIQASALLHQYQRATNSDGCIVAEEADFDIAIECVGDRIGVDGPRLSPTAEQVMTSLRQSSDHQLTMPQLAQTLVDATRHALRTALTELVELGLVDAGEGGRGRTRTYRLLAIQPGSSGIQLLDADVTPVLTTVGEPWRQLPPTVTDYSQVG